MSDYREIVQAALDQHEPRPVGDPLYAPYWARGAYAAKAGTSYTMADGTKLVGGRIVVLGSASGPLELSKYRPQPEKAAEVPRKPAARVLDVVGQLLQEHRTPEQRQKLCRKHGIDWSIVATAPNPGVGTMRLANALRKILG